MCLSQQVRSVCLSLRDLSAELKLAIVEEEIDRPQFVLGVDDRITSMLFFKFYMLFEHSDTKLFAADFNGGFILVVDYIPGMD